VRNGVHPVQIRSDKYVKKERSSRRLTECGNSKYLHSAVNLNSHARTAVNKRLLAPKFRGLFSLGIASWTYAESPEKFDRFSESRVPYPDILFRPLAISALAVLVRTRPYIRTKQGIKIQAPPLLGTICVLHRLSRVEALDS
jgi:hypothetical protein